MKLKNNILAFFVFAAVSLIAAGHASGQTYSGPVMVMPFENISDSDNPKYNWVGESFAVLLPDLFEVGGVSAVSNSDRRVVQQRLRIPMTSLPSLAAAIKMAREHGAKLLVTGTFKVVPGRSEGAETIVASARIIDVASARIVGLNSDLRNVAGGQGNNTDEGVNNRSLKGEVEFEVQGSDDLGTLIGEMSDLLLKQIQGSSVIARRVELINVANKVPADAFEAYVKGVSAGESEDQIKIGFFRKAAEIYAREKQGEMYNEAALELGHLYLKQSRLDDSLYYFSRVAPVGPSSPESFKMSDRKAESLSSEASFYMAWISWRQAKFSESLGLLRSLSERLKNPIVYTMYGGVAVHAGRAEKSGRSEEFLRQGIDGLRLAVNAAPENRDALFNLGLAQFIKNDFKGAAETLRRVLGVSIKLNSRLLPSDGDAQFLLAKALAEIPDTSPAEAALEDDRAKELLKIDNRYANLQTAWSRQRSIDMINVRVRFVERTEFSSLAFESMRRANRQDRAPDETELLVGRARDLYNGGQDDKALEILDRAKLADPMNAEVYYLSGMIFLRRWELDKAARKEEVDKAVRNFRTALFWKPAYFEPYVPLVKIYVERNECVEAQQYLRLAQDNDPKRAELGSLQRQVDRCSTK